jgi:hypothetical protein
LQRTMPWQVVRNTFSSRVRDSFIRREVASDRAQINPRIVAAR